MPKQALDPRHQTNPLIWCAALICAIIAVVVIFTGIFVFVSYLTIKPKVPKISVARAQLNTIYFDQSSLLTIQVTVVVRAQNDNAKAHANFYDTRFALSFGGRRIAYLKADPFSVSPNGSVELNFVPQSSPIPLNPDEADDVNLALRRGLVTFELQGTTRTRWRVGLIGSVKFWLHVHCLLHLPVDMTVAYPNCSPKSNY
ncbi:hypothetical protein PHJA_000297400 [Phtheirospermum japonicum]|uniref:Late embryogenesis abundant protein LEA-2 subgroup domain-containing protein n=1 Tax=Phtheirospermum japonicum TaxID=374723 RepID=A0A830BHN7_9LAMI|nr:hypothetical protein PHJA_000297400 [Phtheirospermum japonicum]